jgi:hypothetical protein
MHSLQMKSGENDREKVKSFDGGRLSSTKETREVEELRCGIDRRYEDCPISIVASSCCAAGSRFRKLEGWRS